MNKKRMIYTWIRNITLVPLIGSIIWLVSKVSRLLMISNSAMITGGRGNELTSFTDIDKYILIVFVVSLTIFLIFNKMKDKEK